MQVAHYINGGWGNPAPTGLVPAGESENLQVIISYC